MVTGISQITLRYSNNYANNCFGNKNKYINEYKNYCREKIILHRNPTWFRCWTTTIKGGIVGDKR